jgi:hypothetical protein
MRDNPCGLKQVAEKSHFGVDHLAARARGIQIWNYGKYLTIEGGIFFALCAKVCIFYVNRPLLR